MQKECFHKACEKKTEDITLWAMSSYGGQKVQLEVLLCKQMFAPSDDILTITRK